MPWGVLANVGVFLAKAIIGMETVAPQPGAGPIKKTVVQDLLSTYLTSLLGPAGEVVLTDPEVLQAFHSTTDAIVHFQNVLAKVQAAKAGSVPPVQVG